MTASTNLVEYCHYTVTCLRTQMNPSLWCHLTNWVHSMQLPQRKTLPIWTIKLKTYEIPVDTLLKKNAVYTVHRFCDKKRLNQARSHTFMDVFQRLHISASISKKKKKQKKNQ